MVNRGRVAATRAVLPAREEKGADAVLDSIKGRRKAMVSQIGLQAKAGNTKETMEAVTSHLTDGDCSHKSHFIVEDFRGRGADSGSGTE